MKCIMKFCSCGLPLFMAILVLQAPCPAFSEEGQSEGVTTSRDSIFSSSTGGTPSSAQPDSSNSNQPVSSNQPVPPDPQGEPVEAADAQTVPSVPSMTDLYTGWTYSVVDRAEYKKGHVKAVLSGSQGTFGLYAVRDDGKEIPLLSSYDFFKSTAFLLRVGRKEYLLNGSGGVKSEARQTSSGVQMAYTIPGKAFFLLDFTFPEDGTVAGLEDTIKVRMYTVNLGSNPQTFTSKAVFDTILGESSEKHFSTYAIDELNPQRTFQSMKQDRWICSANKSAAIEFLFCGADVSEPDFVTLGPIGKLYDYWEPEAHEGKGFSTVLSYNNSGVAVNWKTAYLLPGQQDEKVFYIATAEGVEPVYAGRLPSGDELIEAVEAGRSPFPGQKASDGPASGSPVEKEPVPQEAEKQEPTAEEKPAPAVPPAAEEPKLQEAEKQEPTAEEKPELSEAAKAVTEEQLDYEYIQNLIDYIESLEEAGSIDREELMSLNEELDAIFERLRSMGN